ncbi:hypothetical protein Sjap_013892 [Stephania japonica]|uniref:Protein kinase domain-containing protein n=1 Tax=Stephania japonica TaxID=461633 RepID=A0AAP0J000_9MAGN
MIEREEVKRLKLSRPKLKRLKLSRLGGNMRMRMRRMRRSLQRILLLLLPGATAVASAVKEKTKVGEENKDEEEPSNATAGQGHHSLVSTFLQSAMRRMCIAFSDSLILGLRRIEELIGRAGLELGDVMHAFQTEVNVMEHRANEVVEKKGETRRMFSKFIDHFHPVINRYATSLAKWERRKKFKRKYKVDHVDLDEDNGGGRATSTTAKSTKDDKGRVKNQKPFLDVMKFGTEEANIAYNTNYAVTRPTHKLRCLMTWCDMVCGVAWRGMTPRLCELTVLPLHPRLINHSPFLFAAMAMATTAAAPPLLLPRSSPSKKRRGGLGVVCNFTHFVDAVRKDMDFVKRSLGRASDALHLPKLAKSLEDLLWLRNLENPSDTSFQSPPSRPPNPCYPGVGPLPCQATVTVRSFPDVPYPVKKELTGMDLFMADIKAIEAYATYIYYVSKTVTKPLPEFYDPKEVEDYFKYRPHIVSLRFLEVFASFFIASIKMRVSEILNIYGLGVDKNGNSSEYFFGLMLKEALLNLGPTFIKVGQSLSTRPDIIGSDVSKALSELHDRVPPFPRTLAMSIIEEELSCPMERVFSYISDEPVAAASFGQVYRGRTIDGYDVAIKVQRPNLHHVVVRDIYILRLGLGILRKVFKRKSDPRLYADELGKGLLGELDYRLEATNATEFQEAHASYPFIFVPRVFRQLTGKRVLTMEWVVGESPSDLMLASSRSLIDQGTGCSEREQLEAKRRLLDLVSKGVEAALTQLLETGILHADPHPGNLRYIDAGQIGFLDFGLICRMEKKHQFAMLSSIVHIVSGDWAALVHDLIEMDVVRPGTNIRRVTTDLENELGKVEIKEGIPDIKFSRVLGKILSVAIKYHFRMPPYYTLVLRSLASLEGLAVAADKDFKTFKAAYPFVVRKLLTDNSGPSRRILHSALLNRRKELQWKMLELFIRAGSGVRPVHRLGYPLSPTKPTLFEMSLAGNSGVFDVSTLVLRLLSSKDGVVLRRLLMTVDGASLVQAMVSKEAIAFRQQVARALVDVLHRWMLNAFGAAHLRTSLSNGSSYNEGSLTSGPSPVYNYYESILRDRRLKVIFLKAMKSTMKKPLLMLRFCWASFVIFASASALACHRFLVSCAESYISSVSFARKQFAISA